jgi:hypothetical protein
VERSRRLFVRNVWSNSEQVVEREAICAGLGDAGELNAGLLVTTGVGECASVTEIG